MHSAERVLRGRRIWKYCSTCGSGYPKLATPSSTYQQRIQISCKPRFRVKFRTLNTKVTFVSIFEVILKVKFKVKGRGTGYLYEIASEHVSKWFQSTGNVPGQLTQTCDLWPGLRPSRSKEGVPISSRNYASTRTRMVSKDS